MMQIFLMHVGHPGHVDVKYTVTRRRTIREILDALPDDAPEAQFFQHDKTFLAAFPNGDFHCWGIPMRAKTALEDTNIGDLVLIVPWIGVHEGGIHQIGIVKAKCTVAAFHASRILWPDTPNDRLFPWLIFFDTEAGYRSWYDFLNDVGYDERWNPRGWYRRIVIDRFRKWDGAAGYLDFLRSEAGGRFEKI